MGLALPPPLPPPPGMQPEPVVTFVAERYRSPRARLRWLQAFLALTSLAAGAAAALSLRALQIDDWSSGDGLLAGRLAAGAGVVAWLGFAASWVGLALWTSRMYRNLFALGVGELRFTPGWGLGSWFVPFLNLVRPKQIVDDLWRATDPARRPGWSWRLAPVAGVVHAWWTLVLLAGFFAPRSNVELPDRASVHGGLVGTTGMVVASALGWSVGSELTTRLENVAARGNEALGVVGSPAHAPASRAGRWMPMLLLPALAVLGLGAGTVIGLVAAPAPGAARTTAGEVSGPPDPAAPRTTRVFDLEIGDCFGDEPPPVPTSGSVPAEEVSTVDVVSCDVAHAYELIDVIEHVASADSTFPGVETLFWYGAERCADRFDTIVGTPFLESALDVTLITPTKESWRLGDRDIQCAAVRVDGRQLDQTVVGSGL